MLRSCQFQSKAPSAGLSTLKSLPHPAFGHPLPEGEGTTRGHPLPEGGGQSRVHPFPLWGKVPRRGG
ncbi:hypothetical protein GMPD_42050 [Geomonas paludis]|uniref:Uncharacterized protein n=1 Tax=Geomonas paludis TaxID=2740185 RepID=A0A6V8N1B2_9BACT|nr:hypothetical protein GMPD_42050 [Geomonas paludis]